MLQARLRKNFPAGPDSAGFVLDIDFKAAAGVTVLFGPSGSGKTLTLDLIAGFSKPDDGRVLLEDQILYDRAAGVHLPPQARNCGYVFQNYALFPHMTLRENLAFAAERKPALERHRRVNDMIERFHLTEVAGNRPHAVSGGQKQRCSIARALIGEPKLLLLDEPSQGLDAPLRAELYEVLRQVRTDFRIPMLLVTHDLKECFELGDEMLVVRAGQLVQSGKPVDVLRQPANAEVARQLGTFNLLPAEVRALDPGRNTSRVRVGDYELEGVYFPGKLLGDRITLCIRPEDLSVVVAHGKPGPSQIPAEIKRVIERPHGVRLEMAITAQILWVDLSHSAYEAVKDAKSWVIDFPRSSIRAL